MGRLFDDKGDFPPPLAAVLLAAAILLRIVLAFHPGLWADEIFSLAMATGHSLEHPAAEADPARGDYVEPPDPQPPSTFRRYVEHEPVPAGPGRVIRAVWLSDTNPPLYYLLLNLWTRAAGTSDAALRLLSSLWAVACFPLLWSLALHLGGRDVAWGSWVLFAFSPPALYYSAEGRMYAMVWFLCLLLAWSTLALARRGPRARVVTVWTVSAAAGLLTHYFFAFVLAACLVWLFLHPGAASRLHIAGLVAIAVVIVAPWYLQVPETFNRWRVTKGWLNHPLMWHAVIVNPLKLAGSLVSVSGVWGGPRRANILALAAYGALAVLILRRGVRGLFSEQRRILWLLIAAGVLGPVAFDLLGGTSRSSMNRYALQVLPVALLLLAVGTSMLPRRAQAGFLILLPLVWLPGVWHVFAEPSRAWEPFPQAASRLSAGIDDESLVIVHSIPSGVIGLARYMETPVPTVSWVVQLKQRRVPDDVARLVSPHRRVALVKIHDLAEPSPAEDWLLRNTTHEATFNLVAKPKAEIRYFVTRPQ